MFLVAASAASALILRGDWIADDKRLEVLLSAIGIIAGSIHFFYSQHLAQTQFFYTLFSAFNAKYDSLNGKLEELIVRAKTGSLPIALGAEDFHMLSDYFNLCAEEHLYYDAGFIDRKVWKSWQAGMAFYYKIPVIGMRWEVEFQDNKPSYYGFDLEEIRQLAEQDYRPLIFHASKHDQQDQP